MPLPASLRSDVAQFPRGAQIQAGGWFVQHEGLRIMHQSAGDQNAPRLSARHLIGIALCEERDFEQVQHFARFALHLRCHRVVWPHAHAAEESGKRDLVARVIARTHLHPIVGHDAEMVAQIE